MLRCPPSRINLTASDIAGLEQRIAARQNARLPGPKASNVRLSPGPAHPTRLSVVSAEDNVGRKRAASSSSEATFHDATSLLNQGIPAISASNNSSAWAVDTPTDVQGRPKDQSSICNETVQALESAVLLRQSPNRSSPRRRIDSFYNTDRNDTNDQIQHMNQAQPTQPLDGVVEVNAGHAFLNANPNIPFTSRRGQVLGEIENSGHPVDRLPQSGPRPFSSVRARRRNARSQEVPIYDDEQSLQTVTQALRMDRFAVDYRGEVTSSHPVPELVLPLDASQWPPNPTLDPAAPVFVPRTRYGSNTGSSTEAGITTHLEPQWGSLDSTRNPSNLRIRSSSERNVDNPFRPRDGSSQGTGETITDTTAEQRSNVLQARHRQRSGMTDQNIAIPAPTPNLERYPLLRPPSSLSTQRRTSGLTRINPSPPNSSRPSSSSTYHLRAPYPSALQSQLHVYPVLLPDVDSAEDPMSQRRSVSPAVSTSSRSTPNLFHPPHAFPRIESRSSSLSWNHTGTHAPSSLRIPSMVSAASGVSGGPAGSSTRQSSREGLDAATEFLRMRNSPLDDLTEKFSRLSASRPRSVGRAWERRPSHRPTVSLLTGDPFRQNPCPDLLPVVHPTAIPEYVSSPPEQNIEDIAEEVEPLPEDAVALSLALPPSSPLPTSPTLIPSTPPVRMTGPSSPHSTPANFSRANPCSSPKRAIRRKPVPSAAETPRVKVYDDKKPPDTQPRTPTDITRSRRAKTRSDIVVQQSPIFAGCAMISSPSAIPERHIHCNTYPSATISQASTQVSQPCLATPGPSASANTSDSVLRERARRQGRSQRISEQAENDLEGALHGLEEDRRTWLDRREDGALDITPPRKRRFERYLS